MNKDGPRENLLGHHNLVFGCSLEVLVDEDTFYPAVGKFILDLDGAIDDIECLPSVVFANYLSTFDETDNINQV